MIYMDTESIGFYGPTCLIQWAEDSGDIHIHNIWKEPVEKTLELISWMMEGDICGYNLSHDSYHFIRTYNILSFLPLAKPPSILDYRDIEKEEGVKTYRCVKPRSCLDLLLYGRKNEFQATLNQKDIILKKVPKVLAEALRKELYEKVKIPSIYFAKTRIGYNWRVLEIDSETGKEISPEEKAKMDRGELEIAVDPHFVNLRLSFNPSAALKIIISHITGKEAITLEDMTPLAKPEEYAYNPTFGGWVDVAREHIHAWSVDTRRLQYAKDDVEYLRILHKHFGFPESGDNDSELAWAVGCMYWHGYSFDKDKAQKRLDTIKQTLAKVEVNYNAPRRVLGWIHEACDEMEKQAIPNTKKEVLQNLLEWEEDNPEVYRRVKQVIDARQLAKEKDLLTKILATGRLHVQYKVIGTKSNRMSGGGESYISSRGSINPQGIKKGSGIRDICTLADPDSILCGGDFDGFEVSIAEAEYDDPELRADLLGGKKIHGLFAEAMYEIPYEKIVEHSDAGENEEKGWYARGKRGFFGRLYGAQDKKTSQVLWLDEEEIQRGLQRFFARYSEIKRRQEEIYEDHQALRQPGGIGTAVKWVEPKEYVESFLGFRRFFTLEYSIIKVLFGLANNLPDDLKRLGGEIRVVRRDRLQTGAGAACSAIYAAAFNLQSQVMRSAVNHKIQSPGGQITKELQGAIWKIQPSGTFPWLVLPMNIHDEIQCPCDHEVVDKVKGVVNKCVEAYRDKVPLISMKWKTNLKSWGEK